MHASKFSSKWVPQDGSREVRDTGYRTSNNFQEKSALPSIPHRQTCRNHEFPLANFPFDFSQYVKNSKGEREQARKKEIRGIAEGREGRRGVRGASKLWQFVVGCVDAASAREGAPLETSCIRRMTALFASNFLVTEKGSIHL